MTDLVFRDFANADQPAPGELLLRPRDPAHPKCRALSRLVIEHGYGAFAQADGPIERIVVQPDPTFDDMLAATLVQRLLAGQPLPQHVAALADYAELAREGLNPVGDVPLERSLEGVYLAARQGSGEDLNDPENRDRFLGDWKRIAERLLTAAETVANPFETPLFDGPQFERERTILFADRDVFRQDLARGEKWRITMPGAPPKSLAVLLRSPKCTLFKQWSRRAAEMSLPEAPLLLVVADSGRYRWVVSTDPVQQLSLKPLAETLQAAEARLDPDRAARDPWFDGKRFKHTLIASPNEGGVLPDREVLAIIKHWAKAVPIQPSLGGLLLTRRSMLVGGGAAAAMAAVGVNKLLQPQPIADEPGKLRGDWEYTIDEQGREQATGPTPFKSYALLIATSDYGKYWGGLKNPIRDAAEIKNVLEQKYGFEAQPVLNPTVPQMVEALEGLHRKVGPDDQLVVFIAGHGEVLPETGEGFLVANGTLRRKDDPAMQTFLSHSRVREIIERLPCKHILVVLDVCFAGKFNFTPDFNLGAEGARMHGKALKGREKKVSKAEFIRRKLERNCRRYFASCGEFVPASDGSGEHSPFAQELLDLLNDGSGHDGVLTAQEILDSVLDSPSPPSFGTLKGHEEGGDLLFINKDVATATP